MSEYRTTTFSHKDTQAALDLFADGTASDVVDWCRSRVASPDACHDFLIDFSFVSAEFLRFVSGVVPTDCCELVWGFATPDDSSDGPSVQVVVLQMLTAALNDEFTDLDAHACAVVGRAATDPAWVGQVVGSVAVQVGRFARQAREKALR